jgi:1,4-dihydroxy-2-naphthoate octaprenyltransferase
MIARARAWVKASRLPSQLSIALPLLLGQLVAARVSGHALDLGTLVLVQLFGVLDQLYIVYANDVADEATDAQNTTFTPFSGGSRVLADGTLSRRALGFAAATCAAGLVAITLVLATIRDAPTLVPLALAALLLLQMYSFGPARLSYRGGGELLQMVGVGAVLPLYGYCAQRGDLVGFPVLLLVALLPAHFACAIATALPDEPSDRVSEKRTLPVRIGRAKAARLVGGLGMLASILALFVLDALGEARTLALLIPFASSVGVLLVAPAPPGSRALTVRVALAITSTLSLVGVLIVCFARGVS